MSNCIKVYVYPFKVIQPFCSCLRTPFPYNSQWALELLNQHLTSIVYYHKSSEVKSRASCLSLASPYLETISKIEFKLKDNTVYNITFISDIGERSRDIKSNALNIDEIILTNETANLKIDMPFIFACGLDCPYSGVIGPLIKTIILNEEFKYVSHSASLNYIFDKYNFLKQIPRDDMVACMIKHYPMTIEQQLTLILAFIAYPSIRNK